MHPSVQLAKLKLCYERFAQLNMRHEWKSEKLCWDFAERVLELCPRLYLLSQDSTTRCAEEVIRALEQLDLMDREGAVSDDPEPGQTVNQVQSPLL